MEVIETRNAPRRLHARDAQRGAAALQKVAEVAQLEELRDGVLLGVLGRGGGGGRGRGC